MVINEQGSGVSAGEKQMISFARVLLADPRILILDESDREHRHPDGKTPAKGIGEVAGRSHFVYHRAPSVDHPHRFTNPVY
jgi:ATP-binding cassette subfamily B protein